MTLSCSGYRKKQGFCNFTLVELLVVIAIISILASLLMPALGKAIDQARSISCLSNMKQFGAGITAYCGEYDDWLLISQGPIWSGHWAREIAPFVGVEGNIASDGLISINDKRLISGVFRCHSFSDDTIVNSPSCSSASLYNAVGYGWNRVMGRTEHDVDNPRITASSIKRPSLKLLIGDTVDWGTSSVHYRVIYPNTSYSPIIPAVGDRHGGGINTLMADCHAANFLQATLMVAPSGTTDTAWRYRPNSE